MSVKIHPLFERVVTGVVVNWPAEARTTDWGEWLKAGKPVVEEYDPGFVVEWGPSLREKDARIAELISEIEARGQHVAELEAKLAEAENMVFRLKQQNCPVEDGDGHHCSACCARCADEDHNKIRNAALEEAAVFVERAGLAPGYVPDLWERPVRQTITDVHEFAARIRALKKP